MGFFYELAYLGAKAEGAGAGATNFGRAGTPLGTITPNTVTPPAATAQKAATPASTGALAAGTPNTAPAGTGALAAGAGTSSTGQRSLLG